MPGAENGHPSPFKPLEPELQRMRKSNLSAAIDDVDKVIELLQSTRDQVAQGSDAVPLPRILGGQD